MYLSNIDDAEDKNEFGRTISNPLPGLAAKAIKGANKIKGFAEIDESNLIKELFRTFAEQTSDVVFITDRFGLITYLSAANKNVFGYEAEEMIGMHFTQMLSPESIDTAINEFRLAATNSKPTKGLELKMKRKDGSIFTGELNGTFFKIDEFSGTAGTIRDITEQNATREAIKKSELKYRELADMLPEGIFEADASGILTYANKRAFEMFGFDEDDLSIGMNILDFIPPEERIRGKERLQHIAKNCIQSSGEYVSLKKNGSLFNAYITTAPIIENGNLTGYRGTVIDITERKKIENALKESEEKYRAAFVTSPDSININDMAGIYLDINEGFTNITGYSKDDVIGKSSIEIDIWAKPDDRNLLIKELTKNGFVENLEAEFRMIDGKTKTGLMSARIIKINNTPHILSITRDISERKKFEDELRKAKENAEESDRLKSAFLSNMSHEIRTPLNAILGFSSLLNEPDLTEDERQQFSLLIKKRSYDLLNIISDILDISKIESGQLKIQNIVEDLNLLMEDIFYSYKKNPQFKETAGLEFRLNNELSSEKLKFVSDPFRIKQILFNFLCNSFKFTREGYVEIGCMKSDAKFITFYVKDTGCGIEAGKQKIIFERFRQADETLTRKHEGTGLGLSIAKGLTELLGGKIGLISEEKNGATFYFTIPLRIM